MPPTGLTPNALSTRHDAGPCADARRRAYIERLADKMPPIAPELAAKYLLPLCRVLAELHAERKRNERLAPLLAEFERAAVVKVDERS